jgi:hypothetical protein
MSAKWSVAVLLLVVAGAFTSCKHAPTPQPSTGAAVPEKPAVDIGQLSDAELAALNQQAGLGIGLRVAGTTFHTGKPVPLHIVLEDFAASVPIASGMCGGFYLQFEDTGTHDSGGREISNPRCFAVDTDPDSIPLAKGKVKTVDINTDSAAHLTLDPGHYLLSIEWHAYPAGPATITDRETYSELHSNAVAITITP